MSNSIRRWAAPGESSPYPVDGYTADVRARPDPPAFDVRHVVARSWTLILGCAALSAVAAVVVASLLPRVYEATASLRIDERQLSLPALDVLETGTARNDVSTELEALKSRALAESVADSLGLRVLVTDPTNEPRSELLQNVQASPDGRAGRYRLHVLEGGAVEVDSGKSHTVIGRFAPGARVALGDASFELTPRAREAGTLEIETLSLLDATDLMREELAIERPVRDANILTIRYRSTDPVLAPAVPNAIVGRFMAHRQSVRQREAASTAAFLREQVARISKQLNSAEDSLRSFREGRRVIDPETEGRSQITYVGDLRAQRDQLEAERTSLAQVVNEIDAAADGKTTDTYRNLVAFPSLLRNQATSELLTSLNTLEDRRAELRSRRSEEDPEVKQLTGRVHEIENQLRSLTKTYLDGLTKQIGSLNASLASSNRELSRLPAKEVEFARLTRQTTLLGDMSNLLQTRLKEAEIAVASQDATVHLVDSAVAPTRPVSPKPLLIVAASLVAGVLLGIAVAAVRQRLDRSVYSRNDLVAVTRAPVLGLIPHVSLSDVQVRPSVARNRPGALGNGAHRSADEDGAEPGKSRRSLTRPPDRNEITQQSLIEAFNRLETNIAFAQPNVALSTLVVTSPLPSEGKTSIAINLAMMSALRGRRVLLVDADMRRGALDVVFRCRRAPGLSDVMDQRALLDDALQVVDLAPGRSLDILTAGTPLENAAQLLTPAAVRSLLTALSQRYDLVVLDTPPVNVVADAALLGAASDGVLVVARAGVTTSAALVLAAEHFEHVGAPVVGAVLNDVRNEPERGGDAGYAYYARAAGNTAPAGHPESPTPT